MIASRTVSHTASLFLSLLLAVGSASARDLDASATSERLSADDRLRELYETEWAWRQHEMGRIRNASGDWVDAGRWPDVSAAAQARRLEYWSAALEQLARIPRDELSHEALVNAEVFEQIITSLASNIRFRTYEAPLNSDTFFWGGLHPRTGGGSTVSRATSATSHGSRRCPGISSNTWPTCARAWRGVTACPR